MATIISLEDYKMLKPSCANCEHLSKPRYGFSICLNVASPLRNEIVSHLNVCDCFSRKGAEKI